MRGEKLIEELRKYHLAYKIHGWWYVSLSTVEEFLKNKIILDKKELSRISDLVNHALLFLDGSEIQEKCEKDYNVMVEILTDLRSTIEQIRRELKDE